jgi:putative glutamine amidotransferase
MKPCIGIATDLMPKAGFSGCPHNAIAAAYGQAIKAAGGHVLYIPCVEGLAAHYIEQLDGLLMPGGGVGKPQSWYADNTPQPYPKSPRLGRDTDLIEKALESNLPLLAICEGMQMLAGITGGKLTAQLPTTPIDHWAGAEKTAVSHSLEITPESLLSQLLKTAKVEVNSHHREGVVSVGEKIQITAKSPDGVIEAIEVTGHPFALGVQWHPEVFDFTQADNAPHLKASKRLFKGFVAAAKAYQKS